LIRHALAVVSSRWSPRLRDVGFSRDSRDFLRIRVAVPVKASSPGPRGSGVDALSPVWRPKTRSDSLGLVSTRSLSWGFQRLSLHRHEPATSTPTWFPSGCPLGLHVLACRCHKQVSFRLRGFSPP